MFENGKGNAIFIYDIPFLSCVGTDPADRFISTVDFRVQSSYPAYYSFICLRQIQLTEMLENGTYEPIPQTSKPDGTSRIDPQIVSAGILIKVNNLGTFSECTSNDSKNFGPTWDVALSSEKGTCRSMSTAGNHFMVK